MIIDIIVILKFYLIDNKVSVFGHGYRIRTTCVIIWTSYIPLDKLNSIDEPIS